MKNFKKEPDQTSLLDRYEYKDGMLFYKQKTAVCVEVGDRVGYITSDGYRSLKFDKATYKEHRIIWVIHYGGIPANTIVDHADRNPLNNNIDNLRLASYSQNAFNVGLTKANKSGYKGVWYSEPSKKWVAHIKVNRKSKHLGQFNSPIEAHEAYKKASLIQHKEFSAV